MDKAAAVREKKKKWRERQYKTNMGSKAEGHGFAEKRKQKFVHDYKKLLRKESLKDQAQADKKIITRPKPAVDKTSGNKKMGRYFQAEMEFKKKRKAKAENRQVIQEKKRETNDAMAKYQAKKKGQQKLLSKKNFRGQPNMASRMTLLLSKIEGMQKS